MVCHIVVVLGGGAQSGSFFFFKQKTAYEMRISDWSSDVCSSDLCFDLLDAFASAPDMPADCRLAFVGVGPARSALARRRDEHGLGERVILAGARPHAELPTWMQAAELLCLPSHSEGVPNVVLEAMSCGIRSAEHTSEIQSLIRT